MAPVGADIAAKGRHLKAAARGHDRHGAVVDPGRHRPQARRLGQRDRLFGRGIGGDVDIVHGLAQQGVPDRAADQIGAVALRLQRPQHLLQRIVGQDLVGQPGHGCNLRARPSRIRAVAPQR